MSMQSGVGPHECVNLTWVKRCNVKSNMCQLAVGPVSVHPASKNRRSQAEGVESARTGGLAVAVAAAAVVVAAVSSPG